MRLEESLRRWSAGIAVVMLLAAGALLAGCGGSGDGTTSAAGTTSSTADSASPPPTDAGTPGRPKRKQRQSKSGAPDSASHPGGSPGEKAGRRSVSKHGSSNDDQAHPAPDHRSATDHPARKPEKSAASTGIEGASPVVVAKLRERCPKGMERSACDDLVKTYVAAQDPGSQPSEPEAKPGCPESLSQAQCEAILAQQGPGAEEGPSVSVEECLENMTPLCEALLRTSFEAQTQARE